VWYITHEAALNENIGGVLELKSSARNRYEGTVLNILSGPVSDEIEIILDNCNTKIAAVISSANVKTLGLGPGKRVVVLIKRDWVILVDNPDGVRFASRNQLRGTVVSIKEGSLSAEVNLMLDGGEPMAALVPLRALRDMEISAGSRVVALIKGSHVTVGVKQ
jgi:molybdate transport system regulatory protein